MLQDSNMNAWDYRREAAEALDDSCSSCHGDRECRDCGGERGYVEECEECRGSGRCMECEG